MRELRLFLRDVVNKLGRDRKFNVFAKPVDPMEVRKCQTSVQVVYKLMENVR